jgi:hypothetical protein
MTAFGQVLSSSPTGVKARYFVEGLRNMMFSHSGGACPAGKSNQSNVERFACGDLFRSCGRRPIARRVWRLAAQQQRKRA